MVRQFVEQEAKQMKGAAHMLSACLRDEGRHVESECTMQQKTIHE